MAHAYLTEPGEWVAEGSFWDESGSRHRASGVSRVIHGAAEWEIDSSLHVDGGPSFANQYRLSPLAADQWQTTWESQNEALGAMLGEFILLAETIVSRFTTPGGTARGFETLGRLADGEYRSAGALYVDGRLLSCWEMTLRRSSS